MNRVWHGSSADSSAKRSSAAGSRSMPISVPAGPIRSATRRACPPPPNVQSTATSPGRGSTTSINSPARTGMWVCVMSSSVAKARGKVGYTGLHVEAVGGIAGPIEHLEALPRPDYDDLLVEARVLHELRRDHHPVGGVQLGVMGEPEEESLEVAGDRRHRVEPGQRRARVGVVGVR